jgi:copper chaperone NosL
MTNKISGISRLLLAITSILLVISIFVPLWRIELDAPQYPEGLMMQIFANKLGGQVEIINGLNHYIGMQTLHAENFIEFTILPYIIGFFALLILIAAIVGKKKLLYFSFWAFVLFGIIAMADFWRWEYNYGHNLDPSAAIIVPGMSYQPPLIGFKQLLNFGAYSIPDIGGWLFVSSGLIMLLAVLIETNILYNIFKKKPAKNITALLLCSILFISCNNNEAQPIKLNTDKCDFCAMTISNGRLGAEIITKKGRAYKFDDINCFKAYIRGNVKVTIASFFVSDYTQSNVLIDATKAFYVTSESIKSPMGGNTAAFKTKEMAADFANKNNSVVKTWQDINQ